MAGKITCYRILNGHRRTSLVQIERLLNHRSASPAPSTPSQIAIYCRVSSHDQEKNGDLTRQITTIQEFCRKRELNPSYTFHDISSGLNTRRTELKKLCQLIEQKQVAKVIITYPDRLMRFGVDYLKRYFQSYGAEIMVMHQQQTAGGLHSLGF